MSKVFLSVLGRGSYNTATKTYEYKEASYKFSGSDDIYENTRYIQEASIRHFCKNWDSGAGDRVRILCTNESSECQWQGEGHLLDCLRKMKESDDSEFKNLDISDECKVHMDEGKTRDEIWKIFQTLFETIKEGDEIWMDVTHGFRSLPMLVLTTVPYLRLLKHAEVRSITYGAYEARYDEKKTNGEKITVTPVFDLTDFVKLMDWTNAASNFVRFGLFEDCKKLILTENGEILKETKGQDQEANKGRYLANVTDNFIKGILQNHLDDKIVDGLPIDVFNTINFLRRSEEQRIPPLSQLLEQISIKLESFNSRSFSNIFNAVRWCLDHGFLQNGYSILLEGCISIAVKKLEKDRLIKSGKDNDEEVRVIPMSICVTFRTEDESSEEMKHLRQSMFGNDENCARQYAVKFDTLNKTRNAFMHCGTGHDKLPGNLDDVLMKRLRDCNESLEQWYNSLNLGE